MITNKYVYMLGETLEKCISLETEEEKIVDLMVALKQLGVESYSPIIRKGTKYLLSCQQEDDAWSTPLVTAKCLNILSTDGEHNLSKIYERLYIWSDDGLWGRNTREKPRLAVSAEIIENIIAAKIKFKVNDSIRHAEKLWSRDIQNVPYTFKAISYLSIVSQGNLRNELFHRTIDKISSSIQTNGSLPYVLGTEIGKCDLIFMLRLYQTIKRLGEINMGNLEIILYNYLEKELLNTNNYINHTELCSKSIFSKYTGGIENG